MLGLPHKDFYQMKIMWRLVRNTTNEDTNMEEGSGDSEDDAIPDFSWDVSNMVGGSNVANSSSNPSSSKRKSAHQTTP